MTGPDYKKKEQKTEQNLLEKVLKILSDIEGKLRDKKSNYSTDDALREIVYKHTELNLKLRKTKDGNEKAELSKCVTLLAIAHTGVNKNRDDRNKAANSIEKVVNRYSKTATDNPFLTVQQQNQMVYKQIAKFIEKKKNEFLGLLPDKKTAKEFGELLDSLKADILNCTDPLSSFYGITPDGLPLWAESPFPIGGTTGTEQQQLLLTVGAGILDVMQDFMDRNTGLPPAFDGLFKDFKTELRAGIEHAVYVQRALDGLTIAIKQRAYGKTAGTVNLDAYFARMNLSEKDVGALTKRTSKQDDFNLAIDHLFAAFKQGGEQGEMFAKLVLESNYGENAYCLNALLKEMGVNVPEGTIDKAAAFFKAAATGSYSSDLGRLEKWHPNIANSLVYDNLSLSGENVPVQLAVTRDKYDIVSMLSFLSAYRTVPFMNQMVEDYSTADAKKQKKDLEKQLKSYENELKQLSSGSNEYTITQNAILELQAKLSGLTATSKMDRFFGIVMGLGDAPLPPCVSATVLQSKKTLSVFYSKMKYNVDSFYDILSQVVTDVSVMYQQPFGMEFEVTVGGVKRSSFSRSEAAYNFMRQLEKLPDPKVLDYMMQLLLSDKFFSNETDTENRIAAKDLQQIVLDMLVPLDYMNSSRSKYYQIHETLYNRLQDAYREAVRMVEEGVPSIYTLKDYNYGQNLGYLYLPDTYLSFIRGVFIGMFKEFAKFDPRYATVEADMRNKNYGDRTLQQSYTVDLMGRGNSNVRGSYYSLKHKDDLSLKANIQAKNYSEAGAYITNGVIQLMHDNIGNAVDLESIKGWQLNAKISAISPADLYIVVDAKKVDRKFYENSPDEALIKELDMHAVLLMRTTTGWTRVALDQIKIEREGKQTTMQEIVDQYAARYFVDRRMQFTEAWTTELAVEDIPSQDRAGFLVGMENSQADKRLAELVFKTSGSTNNWVAAIGGGWGFAKQNTNPGGDVDKVQNATPTIVTVGVINRNSPEISWKGGKLQDSDPFTMLASYQIIDKFYLLALGNKEIGGGKVQWQMDEDKYFGANALFHFGHGVDRITGSAKFISSTWSANAFVDMNPKNPAKYNNGGFSVRYLLPNGNAITVAGAHFYPPVEQQLNATADELAERFQQISEDMKKEMESAEYKNLSADQKQERNWKYTQEIIAQLQQLDMFRPLDFMQDQRTEFSVALETPGWTGKVGLVQIGEQKGNYLVSMLDIGNHFSFTAGITSDKDNEVQNFGGMKFGIDNYVFDLAAYNVMVKDKWSAETITVSHLYGDQYDKVWSASLGLIHQNGKVVGHKGDFFIGGQKWSLFGGYEDWKLSGGYSKLKGTTDLHTAVEVYLRDLSILRMKEWVLGASDRWTRTEENMTINELNVRATKKISKASYVQVDLFSTDSWWNGVHDNDAGITLTVGFPIY